ncbi:unnamed protein product, partial [Pylaiella littoralis]
LAPSSAGVGAGASVFEGAGTAAAAAEAAEAAMKSRQQDRPRVWEAEAEWRSALPSRLGALAEVATVDDVGEEPSELRKAWMWYDRPAVAKMLNDVADSMAATGFNEEAADLFERCVDIYLCYAGPRGHGGIAQALNDLGYVLWDACANPIFVGQDVAEDLACALIANAEEVFRLALSESYTASGRIHHFAATCLSNLADCASARLAHEEAASLCRWAFQVRHDCLGPKHLDTADTLRKLGGMLHRQGELEEAEAVYMQALDIFSEMLGNDHEDVGSALNLLAVVVGEQGRYLEAENYHRQALGQRIRAGASGPNDLAPFCYNLALVVGTNARKGPVEKLEQGQRESEALLTEALMVYQNGLPPDHPEIADCMDKLAGAVAMNGDLSRAEILHRESLSIMERTLDPDDPRIAEVLFNLSAVVGGQRGRLGETENILQRCLDAQKRLYGLGHPEVSMVLDKLADVIRARDAASICPPNSNDHEHPPGAGAGAGAGGGGGGSYHHSLTASRRNGMSQSWWDTRSSITSRGSDWFGSGHNSRQSPLDYLGGGDGREAERAFGGGGLDGGGGNGITGGSGRIGGGSGIAGIGKDGAISEEESGALPAGQVGEGLPSSKGGEQEQEQIGRIVESSGAVRDGGSAAVAATAAAAAAGDARPPLPRNVTTADDGMQGNIRVGMRFVAASPTKGSGRRALQGAKMGSFFDVYSRGNSRRGQSHSSSSICSLDIGVEKEAGANRGDRSKVTPLRRNSRRGAAFRRGAGSSSGNRIRKPGRGSKRVGKSGSRVGERGGSGRLGGGSGKNEVGDAEGKGGRSARGLVAARPKGSSAGASSARRSLSGLERDIPRPRPVSYPASVSTRVVRRGSGSAVGGSGIVAGVDLVRGVSRGSIKGKGGGGGGGGRKKSSKSARRRRSGSRSGSYSEADESSLSELSSPSSESDPLSDGSWSASSSLVSSSVLSRSRYSSGSGGGEDEYASIGDVPSLHGDEVVQPVGVSERKRQGDDGNNNNNKNISAFAVNSDHIIDAEYSKATNCWSDGVFETSGDSTSGKSGSGHATAAAAAAAAGAAAASLLSRQGHAKTASAAATAALLVAPPFQAAPADAPLSPDALTARSGLGLVGGVGGTAAATAATVPQTSSADIGKGTSADQPAGGLRRRAKALTGAFRRRGAPQQPTPDSAAFMAGKAGSAEGGGRPSDGDAAVPSPHPTGAPMAALGALPAFSLSSTNPAAQVELQLPTNLINREGREKGEDYDEHRKGGEHRGADAVAAEQGMTSATAAAGRSISLRDAPIPWGANFGRELSENSSAGSNPDSSGNVDIGDTSDDTEGVAGGMGQRSGSSRSTVRRMLGTPSVNVTVSDAAVWAPDDEDKGAIGGKGGGGGGGGRRGSTGRRSVGGVLSAVVPMAAAALSKVNAGLRDGKADRRSSNSSSAT